jgi:hypothetical protein
MHSLAQPSVPDCGGLPHPVSADSYTAASRVLDALRARGTSARRWALERGYRPRTVYAAIRDWAHRAEAPLGGINRQVIADLRADLGPDYPTAPRGATARRRHSGIS